MELREWLNEDITSPEVIKERNPETYTALQNYLKEAKTEYEVKSFLAKYGLYIALAFLMLLIILWVTS